MIRPPYLKRRDTIGIVSTARKVTEAELAPAIKKFQEWGLKVAIGKNLFNEYNQFAGTDEERAEDFQAMLDDPNIKAIVCARGGYGTIRVMEELSFFKFKKDPKWIVGYSDITVIHSYMQKHFSCETIHATMPLNFPEDGSDNESTLSLKAALFGELPVQNAAPHAFNRKGETGGILTGGNLSLIQSLRGTYLEADMNGRILFIEDVDEYLYHIDRMMMNLKTSGILGGLKGMIVGGFSEMKDNDIPFGKNAYEIIKEAVDDFDFPVCFGFEAGHLPVNKAMYMGRPVKLTITEEGVELRFS